MSIFKRGGTYFVRVHLPRARHADIGRAFGSPNGIKREEVRTLETSSLSEAREREKDAEAVIRQHVDAKLRAAGLAPIGQGWRADWMSRALAHRARIEGASADKVLYVEDSQDGEESHVVTERDHTRDEVADEVRDDAAALRSALGPAVAERFRQAVFEDRLTFDEAARRWATELRQQGKVSAKTIAGHEAVFDLFRTFLAGRDLAGALLALADVTRRLAGDFVRWRAASPSSKGSGTITSATIRRELSSLSGLWRWARRGADDAVTVNPWEDQAAALAERTRRGAMGNDEDEGDGSKRAYTPAELVTLLRATGEEWAPNGGGYGAALWDAVRLGLLTGLRANELAGLRCGDVKDGTVTVRKGKTRNARRTVPLCAAAAAIIEARVAALADKTPAAPLFPEVPPVGADGGRGTMLAKRFTVAMRRILGKPATGPLDIDMHSLRRSFAQHLRNAMESGRSTLTPTLMGALMGHAELTMALRVYGRDTLPDHLRRAVEEMAALGLGEDVARALAETAGQRPQQLRTAPAARPKRAKATEEPTVPKRRGRPPNWLVKRRAEEAAKAG